ncbi:MAG: hypothetical protein U0790_00360 [Isosphaeraceae bacterium]
MSSESKPALPLNSGVTLGELLTGYLRHRRFELRPGTIELHEQTSKYLKGFFGEDRRIGTIKPADARQFKTDLADGNLARLNKRKYKRSMARDTLNRHIREARVIFALAVTDQYLIENPFDKLAKGKSSEQGWHYVSVDEFGGLFEAAKPAWKLMLGMGRWAGLRLEETIRLKWTQVDLARHRIEIVAHTDAYGDWSPRDYEKRTIPISPELHELLERADHDETEKVIPVGGVDVVNAWRDFGVLFRKAKMLRYAKRMHSLRKSCTTDWANGGVASRSVQE